MYMNCSKSFRPRPRGGSYDAPTDLLVARGFLPSAIAASRLWRLQFPHGLKFNSIKERWPMGVGGGNCASGLGGIDAPGGFYMQFFSVDVHMELTSTLHLRLP